VPAASFTTQLTLGVGVPVTVNITLPVPPVVTFIVPCDVVICGAVCAMGGEVEEEDDWTVPAQPAIKGMNPEIQSTLSRMNVRLPTRNAPRLFVRYTLQVSIVF